jgi:hypothetical protein
VVIAREFLCALVVRIVLLHRVSFLMRGVWRDVVEVSASCVAPSPMVLTASASRRLDAEAARVRSRPRGASDARSISAGDRITVVSILRIGSPKTRPRTEPWMRIPSARLPRGSGRAVSGAGRLVSSGSGAGAERLELLGRRLHPRGDLFITLMSGSGAEHVSGGDEAHRGELHG